MTKPLFVLNGPNLNLLGVRQPEIYGSETLDDIQAACAGRAADFGLGVDFRQTNQEGVLVEWLHEAREGACACVINPAAYAHTSIALHDAVKAISLPVVECHLSNPLSREAFRHTSLVGMAASGTIAGFGIISYLLAVEAAARLAGRTPK